MYAIASTGAATLTTTSPAVLALWLPKQPCFCCLARLRPIAANASCRFATMREQALPSLLLRGVVVLAPSRRCRASPRHRRRREQSPGRCETGVRCIPTSRGDGVEVVVDSIRSCSAIINTSSTRRRHPRAGRSRRCKRRVHGQVPESHSTRVRNRARDPRLGQGRHRSTRRKV